MRKDHRPYIIRKIQIKFQDFYVEHFLRPQFEFLGRGHQFVRPWFVEVFGSRVSLGDFANVIASIDAKVRLAVWAEKPDLGSISIGRYCLICPGVRVGSAAQVTIGDSCMLANGVYVTDSDWHDKYNRITIGERAPVRIGNNVWLGDRATVCKGVTIGENSIIGAGSVVTASIPPNCVAAGNPARVIQELDPEREFKTRGQWYEDPDRLFQAIDLGARNALGGNSLFHWLRSILFPRRRD
ncbi:MAG: acyltransferase [Deltaproteobacteria bacterium]|nr:acyltransferase [Deltaproteobacteria bacterium]MBW1924055.1 acyltransferase [Deltaproteobacteria bacterium]MBW1950362.1 acyltransferase [Deltaproteobacteria bacterium]MBW2008100.1 acyltransferase [Deltaproteobacteria bacterium]MBW2102428.1 acyltransferase [Deltaproteobacteria bacterium]